MHERLIVSLRFLRIRAGTPVLSGECSGHGVAFVWGLRRIHPQRRLAQSYRANHSGLRGSAEHCRERAGCISSRIGNRTLPAIGERGQRLRRVLSLVRIGLWACTHGGRSSPRIIRCLLRWTPSQWRWPFRLTIFGHVPPACRKLMTNDQKVLKKMILHALSGKGAHVAVTDAFARLDWKLTGVQIEGAPHCIFQLLNHMIYWKQWAVKWLAGQKPPLPKDAVGSWSGKAALRYLCRMARSTTPPRRGGSSTHAAPLRKRTFLRNVERKRLWRCSKPSPCTIAIISAKSLCCDKDCVRGRLRRVDSLGS